MSTIAITVQRLIAGATTVTFNAEADGPDAALQLAHQLAGVDAYAPAAVRADAEVKTVSIGATTTATTTKPAATEKPAEVKKQTAQAGQSTGTTKESTASAAQSGTGESTGTTEALAYDPHVKTQILTLSKEKGRQTVEALLSRYGVQRGPDLKPEQFAGFVNDAKRILAGEYDPMKADEAELA